MNVKNFKNKHEGERVFIVGNGPSLQDTPMDALSDEYTIALNRINLIYSSVDWRPTYYVYVRSPPPTPTEKRLRNYMQTIELGIPSFISSDNTSFFPDRDNIIYIDKDTDTPEKYYEFDSAADAIDVIWSTDVAEKVYNPGRVSSIYVCAQIASYMGFDELIFIGCDGYKQQNNYMVFPGGNDPNEYINAGYLKFLFDNRKPIRSLVNGACFKLFHRNSDLLRRIFNISDGDHFSSSYATDEVAVRSAALTREKNSRFIRMHDAIERIGDECGFDTYNATLEKNIDIHTPVELEEYLDSAV